jgi:hypothetical protein
MFNKKFKKWTLELHGWHACVLHPFYYWPVNKCFILDRLLNMTFCGPAHDTVLTNRQTEKLNFDINYITIVFKLYNLTTISSEYMILHHIYKELNLLLYIFINWSLERLLIRDFDQFLWNWVREKWKLICDSRTVISNPDYTVFNLGPP